jgi:hypothetical protein
MSCIPFNATSSVTVVTLPKLLEKAFMAKPSRFVTLNIGAIASPTSSRIFATLFIEQKVV